MKRSMDSGETARVGEWELPSLYGELDRARKDLAAAYRTFDLVTDPDLIESWTYRISAAQARYHYLLRTVRTYDALTP